MGISIYGDPDSRRSGFPREIIVTLECDVASEFFCRGFEHFRGGYIDSHAAAMKAGWLERQTPEGRQWLCPVCSGKV